MKIRALIAFVMMWIASIANAHLVAVFGPINHDMAEKVASQILSDDGDTVLVIDSPGGDVSAGNLIVSAMQLSPNAVNTMCIGTCASMAAFIFEFGEKRYIWPRATLMLHPPHYTLEGTPGEVRSELDAFDRQCKFYEAAVSAKIGVSIAKYRAMVANELWLSPEQAVSQHLADEIVTAIPN